MTKPVQITFRNMDVSPALEQEVRSRVEWLETFHPGLIGCRVILEVPHRHRQRRRSRPMHVSISLTVPGGEVVVNHAPNLHAELKDVEAEEVRKTVEVDGAHKDPLVTVHDAFDVARRRLEDFARRQRGD